MRKKILVYGICLLATVCTLSAKDKKDGAVYKDAKAPIEKRVDDFGRESDAVEPIYLGTE